MIHDCGEFGNVIVYNSSFERSKLYDLIQFSPKHTDQLQSIINRLKDLMVPFRDRHYYTHEMQGSYSIKKVLPALSPDLSYKDLTIQEGGAVSNTFALMIQDKFVGDATQARLDLLTYCKLDTLAMVKILEVLKHV